MRRAVTLAGMTAVLLSCSEAVVDPPIITATSALGGLVYLDIDGNEALSGSDEPVEGAYVVATVPGTGEVLARDTTDASGEFLMEELPVGTVEVNVDPDFLGDTLLPVPMDSTRFTLKAGAGVAVGLGVTFPQYSVAEARALSTGIRIFTQGVVLNQRGQAPGGAVHIDGDSVAIRVLVPPLVQVLVGDSVRVLGRVGRDLGQPALLEPEVFRVVPGARDVVPRSPSMGEARTGADGLDAALVEFTSGSVVSSTVVAEGYRMLVTDGTDTLVVRLRTAQGFFGTYVDGSQILRMAGLLVADDGASTWSLVPRTPSDVRTGPAPVPPATPVG